MTRLTTANHAVIGTLSKNPRAARLFEALREQGGAKYINLGVAHPTTSAKVLGVVASFQRSFYRTRNDAMFSPFVCGSMERSCRQLVNRRREVNAVIYWGATNSPVRGLPYFIVTDGPFDPHDITYPMEWDPGRWRTSYFKRQRDTYRGASHIFTLSDWASKKIIKVHGISSEFVTKIGWGPLTDPCEHDPHDLGDLNVAPGAPYFLSVGNKWSCKGMDIVSSAAASLHSEYPRVTTLLVGEPFGCIPAEQPGVVQVRRALPAKIVASLIAGATAVVVGSRFEASPHVVMEALQVGTPVIASRVCGVPEAVIPGAGFQVEVGDVAGFAAGMKACLEGDREHRRASTREIYRTQLGGWEPAAAKVGEIVSRFLGSGASK
jgi:glycosyltransferase involved in cell wall biosynthesis